MMVETMGIYQNDDKNKKNLFIFICYVSSIILIIYYSTLFNLSIN
jgi:hypothetical protein